jgi:cytochrome P450
MQRSCCVEVHRMRAISQLELQHLPMGDAAFAADPLPYFAAARAKHPWLAVSSFGYVVHDYSAIKELMWMDDRMLAPFDGIVEMSGGKSTPWGRFTEEQMIAQRGEVHKRMRDIFTPRFTPRQADAMRQTMRKEVLRLLDEWAPKGHFDFEEFASYFPVSVMCRILGASPDVVPGIRSWLETLGLGFSLDPSLMPALNDSILKLDAFVHELVNARRASPPSDRPRDLLDTLIEASDEGGISERQLADLVIFLFVAGYDTSKNVLTYLMYTLTQHPNIYKRCAEDIEYCKKVVEEGLRYFSPATTFRKTNEDIVFRDVLLPKGTMLFFPLSVSGRDPRAFPDPNRFDPDRKLDPNNRHVAFGRGRHLCLGQYIARAQIQEGLHQIAKRLHNPRLDGEPGWRPFPGNWGIKGLPLEFDVVEPATMREAKG